MDTRTIRQVRERTRETGERMQDRAANATDALREFQLKILSATQASIEAFSNYAQDALKARSMPELVEISNSHSGRQTMAVQAREIARAAEKLAGASARPPTKPWSDDLKRLIIGEVEKERRCARSLREVAEALTDRGVQAQRGGGGSAWS